MQPATFLVFNINILLIMLDMNAAVIKGWRMRRSILIGVVFNISGRKKYDSYQI